MHRYYTGLLNFITEYDQDKQEEIKKNLVIKEELRDLISPLSEDEFAQLENNLISEGCQEALVVWQNDQEYILVDGHHRFVICTKHKLDFKVEIKAFKNIEAVKEWMINNQLGRRNITVELKSYLRGVQYQLEKKSWGGSRLSKGHNVPLKSTAEKLAKQHQVSDKTIQRDGKYSEAIDILAGNDDELKWKILNRNLNIPKNKVIDIANKGDEEIKDFRELLKKGKLEEALKSVETTSVSLHQKVLHTPTQEVSEMEAFHSEIIKAFKQATKEKDREALQKMRTLVNQLEKRLFG